MRSAHPARTRGFTLVEIVVAVLVIGILAAVAAVSYQQFTGRSRGTASQASATQAAKAVAGVSADKDQTPDTVAAAAVGSLTGTAASDALKTAFKVTGGDVTLSYQSGSPGRLKVTAGTRTSCVVFGTQPGQATPGSCVALLNGGFETAYVYDQPDRLEPYYAATLTRDTTVAHAGAASLRVDLASTQYPQGAIIWPTTGATVSSGSQVVSGAWVKVPAGVAFNISGRVQSTQGLALSEGGGQVNSTGTGAWQYVETQPWTYTGASDFYPGVQIKSNAPQSALTLWIDDAKTSAS